MGPLPVGRLNGDSLELGNGLIVFSFQLQLPPENELIKRIERVELEPPLHLLSRFLRAPHSG